MIDLSTIIVNWRAADVLVECVEALLKATQHTRHQVIVVDNHSRDGSPERVQRAFPQVTVLFNPENRGFAKAVNQGLERAEGRYILLLNPDTRVDEKAVERMLAVLETQPEVGAVGPMIVNSDGSYQRSSRRALPTPARAFYKLAGLAALFPSHPVFAQYHVGHVSADVRQDVEILSGSVLMTRRDVVDQVGGLDERFFLYGEDIDWCYRVGQAGWRIVYLPEARVVHHHRLSSRQAPVRSTYEFYRSMILFYEKHWARRYGPVLRMVTWLGVTLVGGAALAGALLRSAASRCLGRRAYNTT